MKSLILNRRQVLVSATSITFGALLPQAAAQQPKPSFPAKDAGAIHEDMLHRISEKLGQVAIDTEQGLLKIVELLRESELISPSDQEKLDELIKTIFSSADPNVLMQKIDQIYKESVSKVGDVAAAVISIARSSVQYAREKAKENTRILHIVSRDVLGALTGATAGIKLGTYFAVIGALAGAIAESAEAALAHPAPAAGKSS